MLFKDLKRNLTKDFSGLPLRRLAMLGDSATQFLAKAIRGHGFEEKINFEIFEADFDQLDRQILDPGSELYHSNPEFIVLYLSSEKLWNRFTALEPKAKPQFADQILSEIANWWRTIAANSKAKIIHFNLVEVNDGVFGHFANRAPTSFLFQVRKLNYELMNLVREHRHVFIVDMAALSNAIGYATTHDPRLHATSKVALSLEILPAVAKAVTDVIEAVSGNFKKCLILDLDNTVWGGVIGDDGMEGIQLGELGMGHAFDALQQWARELKRRGIILAVCSKNEEENARRPFREHPDMILRPDDIAVFIANWNNKADNIKLIQQALNIGFDSMVFVDDNPFERNLVREHLPAVTVPELPEDPAMYVSYLRSLNLFETASFSEEDQERTKQYQQEIARTDLQKTFTNIDDYIKSLDMVSVVKPFDDFNVPRIAQLTQRSNQFNLRTVRYTEADVKAMSQSPEFITLSFNLEDKFGDHGLIALIILKQQPDRSAFIDTWIMSCRVLKRGMEEFTVNQMVARARAAGIKRLVGEYLSTPKNAMVKDLYAQMGFVANNGKWSLNLMLCKSLKTYILEG